jgi:hypothetical protein
MTHSQGSNSVAKHSALIVSHPRLFEGHSILTHQNTEKFQGMASFNARTDTGFSFLRLLSALPSQTRQPDCCASPTHEARSRWPEADPTNTTVTQSYHRETASTHKAEVERTGRYISGARPVDQVERRRRELRQLAQWSFPDKLAINRGTWRKARVRARTRDAVSTP